MCKRKSGNNCEHPQTHHLDPTPVAILQDLFFHRCIHLRIHQPFLPFSGFKSELQTSVHFNPEHFSFHRSLTRTQYLSAAFEKVCNERHKSHCTVLQVLRSAYTCVMPTPLKTWDVSTSPEFPQALSVNKSTPLLAGTVLIDSMTFVLSGSPYKWDHTVRTPVGGFFHTMHLQFVYVAA